MRALTRASLRVACAVLVSFTQAAFYHKDFSSTRGWKFYGDAKQSNNTLELIPERYMFADKTWKICSIWSKRKVYWHEGFEMKFVFRLRSPDATNNGGEGFAMVFQQNRPNAMGDLMNKGSRPNGQTFYPSGLGLNELTKSFAIKFDTNPQTTDPSAKHHISIHEGGDYINPKPKGAFTDRIPPYNNGHDHTIKIFYDIEDDPVEGKVGMMRMFWTSDYQGEPVWGTLDEPIFVSRVHFDALDKEPAWIGLTSATSSTAVQTVNVLAWTYHEIKTVDTNGRKCNICGGKNPRCCQHWERMKNERDGTKTNSFISNAGHYIGQDRTGRTTDWNLVNKPRLWQHQVWDIPTYPSPPMYQTD